MNYFYYIPAIEMKYKSFSTEKSDYQAEVLKKHSEKFIWINEIRI